MSSHCLSSHFALSALADFRTSLHFCRYSLSASSLLSLFFFKILFSWTRLSVSSVVHFLVINAENSLNDRLFRFINIDDLERSWTPPKRFLVNFSQCLAAAHISRVNCKEMAGDRPRQPAYKIFSIKRRFYQFKSRPPRFKEAVAGGRQSATPLKVVILPQLSRVAWKWLQVNTDMLLIITSNSNKLFIGVNVDDFKWPWTSKMGVFSEFVEISGCDAHFKSELCRNGWRWAWTTCVWHCFSTEHIFLRTQVSSFVRRPKI